MRTPVAIAPVTKFRRVSIGPSVIANRFPNWLPGPQQYTAIGQIPAHASAKC
jgi:hypothetical protein